LTVSRLAQLQISVGGLERGGFSGVGVLTIEFPASAEAMPGPCSTPGCKAQVPVALDSARFCVLHFTLSVEQACAEMRRETVLGNASHARQVEIIRYITEHGEMLARVATSGLHLPDEMKARILSTFLTLINLRENLDRAALRLPPGRGVAR